MKDKKDEILNKAFELGKKYEQECTGCAQTAVAAIFESLGIWNEGSCRCFDVQEKTMGRTFNLWNADEMKEAFKAGMMDKCSTIVGNVAKLATKIILKSGFEPK